MMFLKQSTGATLKIGPFLDDTDGKTAETALTISQADVRLSKNGGDIAQKNEATSCTHDELGVYGCPIDATDTGTLGILQLWVHEAGALPVWHEYMVVPANVWDSLFGSDRLQVDVREKGDSALALTTQEKADVDAEVDEALNTAIPGTPTADSVNERVKAIDDKLPTNYLMGSAVVTAKDDEIDAIKAKTDLIGASVALETGGNLAAVKAKTDNLPADPADDSDIDAQLATIAGYIDTEVAAILADTNELQTDWANGGRLDLLLDAAKEAVDTEVAAIKAVTDTLTLAAIADAVNDEAVEGTLTLRQMMKLFKAALAGKSAGGGSATITFRDNADTKNRITATVDADGNRTAVTLDVA